jgi:hypothetical protein
LDSTIGVREGGKNQRTEEQEKESTAGSSLKKLACFGKRNQVSQILLLLKISEFTQRLIHSRGAAESSKLSQDFSSLHLGSDKQKPRTVRNWNSSNNHRWEQRNLPRTAATVGAIKELSRGRGKSRDS